MQNLLYTPLHVSYISAKEKEAKVDTRLSCAYRDCKRQECTQAQNAKRAQTPSCVRFFHLLVIRAMLSKRHKLTHSTFPPYTKPKKTWNGQFLRIQYFSSNSNELPRFAVVISKKIEPSAVGRNRIKRAIFNCIQIEHRELTTRTGFSFLLFPQKKEGVVSIPAIQKDIADFAYTLI